MSKLTRRRVDAIAVPHEGERFVWDGRLTGFGLRVRSTGVKTLLIQYRNADGRTRRMKLATVDADTKVEAIRKLAIAHLASVTKGGDPSARKRERLHAETVRDLSEDYLKYVDTTKPPPLKPSSIKEVRRLIERRILPKLGAHKVASVTREDIEALHRAMAETPYQANRTVAAASALFRHAIDVMKLPGLDSNPAHRVKKFPVHRRERTLHDDDCKAIFAAVDEAERTQTETPTALLAIRLLFATGCRASEICGLRWDYIDERAGKISWPDTKSGALVKPLTTETRALLKRADRIVGNPFVCHGIADRAKPLSYFSLADVWGRILKRAGVQHAGLHVIRHRVVTDFANSGAPVHIAMALSGHKSYAAFKTYLHLEDEQVTSAAEAAALKRAEAIAKAPDKPAPEDNVARFPMKAG